MNYPNYSLGQIEDDAKYIQPSIVLATLNREETPYQILKQNANKIVVKLENYDDISWIMQMLEKDLKGLYKKYSITNCVIVSYLKKY